MAASVVGAQERAAAQAVNTQSNVTSAELLQKLSHLQQVVRILEERARACGTAKGSAGTASSTGGNSPDDNEGFSPGRADESDE